MIVKTMMGIFIFFSMNQSDFLSFPYPQKKKKSRVYRDSMAIGASDGNRTRVFTLAR